MLLKMLSRFITELPQGLRNRPRTSPPWFVCIDFGTILSSSGIFSEWPMMTSNTSLIVYVFHSSTSTYYRLFHYYPLSLCPWCWFQHRNNTFFLALKPQIVLREVLHEYRVAGLAPSFFQKLVILLDLKCFLEGHICNAFYKGQPPQTAKQQNFSFSFWTPWLDWFGVSCLRAGPGNPPSLCYKAIWNSTTAVWCFSWEPERQKSAWRMQPCGDHNDFPAQKHLPFWCENTLNATNGISVLGEVGWELMQILLSQSLVSPFLKALAALHKQNCPHKDRKLSNRGIALVHWANITVILNNNFKP